MSKRDPGARARDDGEESPETTPVAESAEVEAVDAPAGGVPATLAEPEERYLRLAADFENFRRRKNQEMVDRSRYASLDAATALLPVLDNLRRAVAHAAETGTDDLFVSGLELVVREFETALEKLGVEPIEAEGQPFDPALHEAIGGEEREGVDVDTVIDEVQRGYRLRDRVIRPSLVRLAHPVATTREAT
ncbi:MAG TPA: nucleotide exchange factor GrpE [Candidatus Dormibacteraeota bacterium]|jgi:molecular chaperone GrpE